MNLDLLTLLENIVSGFVSFFYSLARSLFATARRPIRGPLRLYRTYKSHKVRQIGGVTFLCMGFFLSFYVLHQAEGDVAEGSFGAWLRSLAVKAVQHLPETGAKDLWPVVVASLTATIVVDAAARTYLDLRRVRHGRRDLVLGSVEFALFWTAPIAVVFALFFWIGVEAVGPGIAIGFSAVTLFPLLMLLSIPAARILRAGVRPPAAARHPRLITLAIVAGVALLIFVAALAGAHMWMLIEDVKL